MKRLLVQPEIGDKIKVVRWDFIKLKYKYELIRKLDYDICSICDLEQFYDIVFEIHLQKYEQQKKPSIFDSGRIELSDIDKENFNIETGEEEKTQTVQFRQLNASRSMYQSAFA